MPFDTEISFVNWINQMNVLNVVNGKTVCGKQLLSILVFLLSIFESYVKNEKNVDNWKVVREQKVWTVKQFPPNKWRGRTGAGGSVQCCDSQSRRVATATKEYGARTPIGRTVIL